MTRQASWLFKSNPPSRTSAQHFGTSATYEVATGPTEVSSRSCLMHEVDSVHQGATVRRTVRRQCHLYPATLYD
eukprot:15417358-Heterocapsa_arctica.AAC.1